MAALEELGDGVLLTQNVADARTSAADARSSSGEARAALETFKREGELRSQRLASIADEAGRWDARRSAAASQIAELSRRHDELTVELSAAERVPEEMADRRGALLTAIAGAEAARHQANDARVAAEAVLADADKHAKAADQALSAVREERARAQALSESAAVRIEELRTRIHDELECMPDELSARAEIKDGEELPPLEQAEKKVERLKQEREQLGGVNLRAEEEAAEQETRLNTLVADRDDLAGAIERLRRGIQSLNREGRERLLASFEKVNKNFRSCSPSCSKAAKPPPSTEDPKIRWKRARNLARPHPASGCNRWRCCRAVNDDRLGADLCRVPGQSRPGHRAGRSGRALGRRNVERFCNMLDQMTEMSGTTSW